MQKSIVDYIYQQQTKKIKKKKRTSEKCNQNLIGNTHQKV